MNTKILGNEEVGVLKELQKAVADSSIIAGGAVRDKEFGMPYKDVDIFLPLENKITSRFGWGYLVDELLPSMFSSKIAQMKFAEDYDTPAKEPQKPGLLGWNKPPTHRALNFRVLDMEYSGTRYQLIFTRDIHIAKLFKTFDFNCNMILFDGMKTRPSKDFMLFKTDKTLTAHIRPTRSMLDRALSLVKKYPDWKLDQKIIDYQAFLAEDKKASEAYFASISKPILIKENFDLGTAVWLIPGVGDIQVPLGKKPVISADGMQWTLEDE